MKYRLIVSDFDGTLRRSGGSVSEYTKEAIRDFRADGGIFAICTGRMLASILPIARSLALEGLVVAYQGNVIADIGTGEILLQKGLSCEDAVKICRHMEEMQVHIHVYTDQCFYSNRADDALREYESIVGVKGVVIEEEPLSKLLERERPTVIKLMAMVDATEKLQCYTALNAAFGDEFYVTYSAANLVEITAKDCNKGTALLYLCKHYNIPVEQSIALGDNFNDAPMVEAAGLGVAVENAGEELKAVADYITASNNEDGVAKVIRRFGLGENLS